MPMNLYPAKRKVESNLHSSLHLGLLLWQSCHLTLEPSHASADSLKVVKGSLDPPMPKWKILPC